MRGIRALARRLGAKLVVTGQENKPPELEGLHTFVVNRPSLDLKHRIAQSTDTPLSPTAVEVLKAVGSGIEAEIVGQIGSDLKASATRLTLVDQYIRKRLAEQGRQGAFGLRHFASRLHELVAFSISEADFDEFMRASGVSFEVCDAIFAAGLLVRRAGRVSFSHEIIQNACAAFNLARQASAAPAAFGFRLCTPILEGIAGDAVTAIDSSSICRAVLEAVTDSTLLADAACGRFGPIAASAAQALLYETAKTCATEIRGLQLSLVKKNDGITVHWVGDCRRDWTKPEEARLHAIGRRAISGNDIDTYLELCAIMDERLASEQRRLAESAKEAKFPLKSRSFALAYYGFYDQIGFTYIAHASKAGLEPFRPENAKHNIKLADLTSGQLHFFLENRYVLFDRQDEGKFAEELITLLHERFRSEPYHVQLDILQAVTFAHSLPDETRKRLVEAIDALKVNHTNWAINSCIIDALKSLGEIDEDDEIRHQIKQEIESVLVEDEHDVDKNLALSVCLSMFDHPYDWIYSEEISELDENRKHLLYRRALGSSEIRQSMFLAWLCEQVASFEDAADAPLFRRLAGLPDPSNSFPQEEWGGFVIAISFLGKHGARLPEVTGKTPAAHCLAIIRKLIYAAESGRQSDLEESRKTWLRLHAMPAQIVIGCLSEVQVALTDRHWSGPRQRGKSLDLSDVYPTDCLRVARRFIDDGREAQYFHSVPYRETGSSFAFKVVERLGDRSDIDRLRKLTRAHPFASHALVALKTLDAINPRSTSSTR